MASSRSREARKRRRAAEFGAQPREQQQQQQTVDPSVTAQSDCEAIADDLRTDIDELIRRIEGLLRKHDPLDLITPIATWTQVTPISEQNSKESASDDSQPFSQADLEYALSFALALPDPAEPEPVTPAIVNEFGELLVELRTRAPLHTLFDAASELQGMVRTWTTSVRGDNYWPIGRRICQGLFAGTETFMLERLTFGPNDVLRFADRVDATLLERFRNAVEQIGKHLLRMKQTLTELASKQEHLGVPPSDLLAALVPMIHAAHASDIEQLPEKLAVVEQKDIFEVVPTDETERRIAQRLAVRFGENRTFLEGHPDRRGWPLGETLVRERPFVCRDGKFYALAFVTFKQSARMIVESLLKEIDPTYFRLTYLPLRDKFLEQEIGRLMGSWFGSSNVYEGLYYSINEGGVVTRYELDCLVSFGDVILLVEAKAGALAPRARRGDLGRLKGDLNGLIEKAHRQAERALSHLRSTSRARFTDKRNREVFVADRARTSRVISVNVTLEDLTPIAPNVSKFFPPEGGATSVLRWTVSLADLMVIRDIIPSPTAFLHYLHRRDMMRRGPEVRCGDELDLMMLYLQQGLWIEEDDFGHGKVMFVAIDGSFTNALNDYYARVDNGLSATKPKLELPKELGELLAAVDRSPRRTGPSLMFSLLDCADEARRMASEKIRCLEQLHEDDGRPHSLSLGLADGVVLLACGKRLMTQEEARVWARGWLSKQDVKVAYVSSWVHPLETAKPHTWKFDRKT